MSSNDLKVKTSAIPGSRIAVELEVSSERCKNSYEEAVSRLCRTANLPGFRKGKVPRAVILQQFGVARIKASALESLLQKSWEKAIEQESLEPLCEPELKDGFETLLDNFNPDKDLKITLETDIAPEPTLKSTKGLKAEAEKVIYDPNKIDELIEQSRKELATLVPVEKRAAKMGDVAVVSFKGHYEDGSVIEGGSADSMDLELEDGRMIPGFIEGIIGMNVNEEKILKCQFPDDYHQEESKGKKANFNLNLKDLKTRELPKLDDEFAKQTSDKDNMSELRADLEKRLKEEAKRGQVKARQESLLNALVKELVVEIPNTMIEIEVRNIIEQTARNFSQQGIDVKSIFTPELVESLMKSSRQEAEDNLRKNLALNALSKAENIEINEKDIETRLKELQATLSEEKNIDQSKLKQVVSDELMQDKLLQWLEENNTVIEKSPEKKVKTKQNESKTKESKGKTQKKSNKISDKG
ncbi:trigger factor [Prochlorococcus sp. MIT 1223]|uniref:trigger factor n=1 Tax=Prochlorococcus sp. MIT 1223 TaxID=3096217 RepID=UPI002A747E49|nr:trigger factor [Prochlorococcus sp. MIT 1223]